MAWVLEDGKWRREPSKTVTIKSRTPAPPGGVGTVTMGGQSYMVGQQYVPQPVTTTTGGVTTTTITTPQKDIYTDPMTGAQYSMMAERQPGKVYEVIDGQRVDVSTLQVKRKGPYKAEYEYEPYQKARVRDYDKGEKFTPEPKLFGGVLDPGRDVPPPTGPLDWFRRAHVPIMPFLAKDPSEIIEPAKGAVYAPFSLVVGLKDIPKAVADPIGTGQAMIRETWARPGYTVGGFMGSVATFGLMGKGVRAPTVSKRPPTTMDTSPFVKGKPMKPLFTKEFIKSIEVGWEKGAAKSAARVARESREEIIKTPGGPVKVKATAEKKITSLPPRMMTAGKQRLAVVQKPKLEFEYKFEFTTMPEAGQRYGGLTGLVGPKRKMRLLDEDMIVAYPPGTRTMQTAGIRTVSPVPMVMTQTIQRQTTRTKTKQNTILGQMGRLGAMERVTTAQMVGTVPATRQKAAQIVTPVSATRTRRAMVTTQAFKPVYPKLKTGLMKAPPIKYGDPDRLLGGKRKKKRPPRKYRYTPSLGGVVGLRAPTFKIPKTLTGLRMRPILKKRKRR